MLVKLSKFRFYRGCETGNFGTKYYGFRLREIFVLGQRLGNSEKIRVGAAAGHEL